MIKIVFSRERLRSLEIKANNLDKNKSIFSILVVDDEPGIRDFLSRTLDKKYSLVVTAASTEEAELLRRQQHFDLLIVDICMPGQNGVEWLSSIEEIMPSALIVMTGFAELDHAVESVRLGASDFIHKPFRLEQMMSAVERVYQQLQLARENRELRRRLGVIQASSRLVGKSQAIAAMRDLIERVAPLPSAVLIEGETGTGKELVAMALHELSGREGSFVPVNCGAISPDIIESELFGHVKGAYTGAVDSRQGLFSHADGGTLFLDEIVEMPLPLQAKLLRVLEESRVRPVGGEQTYQVDVRIVAACNRNLAKAVEEGQFREDLFYRLNVLPLQLPPLRHRLDDIPELVTYINEQLARELGLSVLPLNHEDMQAMQSYQWPGNVRELRNLIERCMLLGQLPAKVITENAQQSVSTNGYPINWALADVEADHMRRVIDACDGNKTQAAEILGVSSKTLSRRKLDDV